MFPCLCVCLCVCVCCEKAQQISHPFMVQQQQPVGELARPLTALCQPTCACGLTPTQLQLPCMVAYDYIPRWDAMLTWLLYLHLRCYAYLGTALYLGCCANTKTALHLGCHAYLYITLQLGCYANLDTALPQGDNANFTFLPCLPA